MIGKLLRLGSLLFAYFCIATIIAQLIGLGILWNNGGLASDRLMQAVAAMQGVDLVTMKEEAVEARITINPAQPSIDDIVKARALGLRQIEMKEIAVTAGKQLMDDRFVALEREKQQFQIVRKKFDDRIEGMYSDALVEGRDNARLLLENLKPKQAKEQILQMLEAGEIDEVVTLLGDMPISKRGKIAREFKANDEVVKLAKILERVREGKPDTGVVDQIRQDKNPKTDLQQGG